VLKTRITEKLGVKHPIIQGAMLWMSRAELAAAVSDAGGLGILSSPTFSTKEVFRQEVRKIKNLTDKPFGVNLVYLPSARDFPNDDYINIILEEGVRVVETVGPIQPRLIEELRKANVMCLHKATSVRHLLAAERSGYDAVTVEGFECAGHTGMGNVTSLILIQRAVEEVKIPVIAGGGFGDGKGLLAALALGAEGILMGTRFLVTKESPAHPNIKEWCLKAKETDTIFALTSLRDPVRYMRTDLAERVLGMEARGADLKELLPMISGLKNKQALESGDLSIGVCTCGQCVGLIHDIPTVKELIDRIVSEAEDGLSRLNALR
jgi:NAD(P)H-dependent flavin oxidoreductase YrpB (nitropropane dioxygenase family)